MILNAYRASGLASSPLALYFAFLLAGACRGGTGMADTA